MKRILYIMAALLLILPLAGCGYRDTIARLEGEVSELEIENNALYEELSGMQQEADLLESSLDEMLSATPEPTPEPQVVSLGVTPDQLNENILYLLEDSFEMLGSLPAPESGTSINGNEVLRYQLTKNITMEYTLNILGGLQSVVVSYDFTRLDKKEEGKFGNYTALVATAYVMALENPLSYSGAVAFRATDIITTGSYRDGAVILTTGNFPNRHIMRLYAEYN